MCRHGALITNKILNRTPIGVVYDRTSCRVQQSTYFGFFRGLFFVQLRVVTFVGK
jgi:hypothetical protein